MHTEHSHVDTKSYTHMYTYVNIRMWVCICIYFFFFFFLPFSLAILISAHPSLAPPRIHIRIQTVFSFLPFFLSRPFCPMISNKSSKCKATGEISQKTRREEKTNYQSLHLRTTCERRPIPNGRNPWWWRVGDGSYVSGPNECMKIKKYIKKKNR